ncbi:hypothetical protein ABXS75_10875 [Roseburia hominis]
MFGLFCKTDIILEKSIRKRKGNKLSYICGKEMEGSGLGEMEKNMPEKETKKKEIKHKLSPKSMLQMLLLISFLVFLAYIGYRTIAEPSAQDQMDYHADGENSGENEAEKGSQTKNQETSGKKNTFTEEGLDYSFQIINMRQEAMDLMGLEIEELADALHEWTYYNGYSMATTATFYPYLEIDFRRQIYKMTMRLDDDVRTIVNLQYYRDKKSLVLNAAGAGGDAALESDLGTEQKNTDGGETE